MSANFWASSHHSHWIVTKLKLDQSRMQIHELITPEERIKLEIYFSSIIHKITRSIAHVLRIPIRQQIIATAIVYFKRFYTKNEYIEIDPILMCATCFYLASKVEECPTHIKTLVNEMKLSYPSIFSYDTTHVSECEFYLLQDLEYYTVVFHPYKTLYLFIHHLKLEKAVLQTCSFLLNDMYRTDLCLLQPPHVLAVTSLYISCVCNPNECNQQEILSFFQGLHIDMMVVIECAQTLFNLYSVWNGYHESQIPEIIQKLRHQ
jgi:cyclin-C